MEMFRNVEVVLVLCFGLLCAAAMVARPHPQAAQASAADNGATVATMPVVIVTGKRLSAAQKARAHGEEAG